MVEPAFLAVGAIVFFVLLVIILRSAPQKEEKKIKKRQKTPKQQGAFKKKGAKKHRNYFHNGGQVFSAVPKGKGNKDKEDEQKSVLEFLKGRDPKVIAQILKQEMAKKKKGTAQVEEEAPQPQASVSDEEQKDFEVIQRKKQDKPKKPKRDQEGKPKKPRKKKEFFKGEQDAKKKEREEQQKRAQQAEAENQKPGEKQERPPKQKKGGKKAGAAEGGQEKRPPREGSEKRARPPRRPLVAPGGSLKNIEPELGSLLDMITAEEMKKPRVTSVFSMLERKTVLLILFKLEVRDLLALSRVNRYFNAICRTESLWRELANRDFNLKSLGTYRNWKQAYKNEYLKLHPKNKGNRKKKEEEEEEEKAARQEPVASEE